MGQKINPISFRLAVNKDWRSKWYATGKEYTDNLHEDLKIRKYIKKNLHMSGISKVIIERAWNSVRVTLSTARPGLVIGRKGAEIERMTNEISALCGGCQVKIDIIEIRKPELRRPVGCRKHLCAARAPDRFPPRHETRRADRHGIRGRRHPRPLCRPSRWCRYRPCRMV